MRVLQMKPDLLGCQADSVSFIENSLSSQISGTWWTASLSANPDIAYSLGLITTIVPAVNSAGSKGRGFSVRSMKDA